MEATTITGLALGTALVAGALALGGGDIGAWAFLSLPALMITIGGTLAATLIQFPAKKLYDVAGTLRKCVSSLRPTEEELVAEFKSFAAIVKRSGPLAIEAQLDRVQHSFLRRGLEVVASSGSREDMEWLLKTETTAVEQRFQSSQKVLESCAAAAPAFGMAGTLIGVVQMLQSIDDAANVGPGMATALLTTLYGVLIANLVCTPLAGKIEARLQEELHVRELIVTGLAGLLEEQTPRSMEERLLAFGAPEIRSEQTAKAA